MTVYGFVVEPNHDEGAKVRFVENAQELGHPTFTEYPGLNNFINGGEFMWLGNNYDDAWFYLSVGQVEMLRTRDGKDLFPGIVGAHALYSPFVQQYDGETIVGFDDKASFVKAFVGDKENSPIRGFIVAYSASEFSWQYPNLVERLERMENWLEFLKGPLEITDEQCKMVMSRWLD
jgi:hypothetical protein